MTDKIYVNLSLPERFLDPLRQEFIVDAYDGPGRAPRETLLSHLADASALLGFVKVDKTLLAAAPELRIVSNIAVGYDNVDLEAATQRGVIVTNTPDVLTDAVADLTMALILQLSRRIDEGREFVRDGRWQHGESPPLGHDLKGKTLAIVGMGRIGTALARRAAAFGMRIVYHDIRAVSGPKIGAEAAGSLADALRQADFVSLHANLTPESEHCLGRHQFALMKPTAYLVNTARGAIVDQDALREALQEGRIAGAALDVLSPEPPASDDPLLKMPNVIITPTLAAPPRRRAPP